MAVQSYPEDIECVLDPSGPGSGGIFVSNLEAAQNPRTLQKHGIRAVLTAANGACLWHSRGDVPYYKYVAAEDKPAFDLSLYFEESAEFIRENLQRTNVTPQTRRSSSTAWPASLGPSPWSSPTSSSSATWASRTATRSSKGAAKS